jgi:hypothetical protein
MIKDDDLGAFDVIDEQLQVEPNPDPAPDFDMLRRMFREACSATETQRKNAREDRDFYDGPRQLDDASRAKMRRMRVPETYANKIGTAIGATLGLLDSNETYPEATGRNDDDDASASLVTQILRYQADVTRLPKVLDSASENDLVEGICAAKIEVDSRDNCLVTHIPYDEFYYDPHSRENDFADANYLIHAYWSDVSAVKRKWPQFKDQITTSSFSGDGPEDKPDAARFWVDGDRRRVMLVDNFYKDASTGEWKRAIYCHSTILEYGPSGYLDDEGRHICPIEGLSFHIMRDGERRGMVRNLVPLQRKINGMEAALHKMAISNRVQFTGGASGNPVDRETARKEAQRTDAAMPEGWSIMSQDGRFMEMAQAVAGMKQEIEDASPARAQIAQAGANTSGRARQMLQQSGLTELSRNFGQWENFEERIYRQMWFRVRQFMTEQTMIRITDNAGAKQTLHINVPVVETRMQPVVDPQTGQPLVDPMTGQPRLQPVQVQTGTHNELAQLDIDIKLTVVQTADTLRDEAQQKLLDFTARNGVSLLDPSVEFLLEFLNFPGKDLMLAKWREIRNQAQQQQAQAQQAQQAQAQQMQAVQAQSQQAHAAREQAAAQRDQTLAAKHEQEVQGAQLDNAWKAAMLNAGRDPNTHGF